MTLPAIVPGAVAASGPALDDPVAPPAPPPSPSAATADAALFPEPDGAHVAGPGHVLDAGAGAGTIDAAADPVWDALPPPPPPYHPGPVPVVPRVLSLAAVAALFRLPTIEAPLRGSSPIRVVPRAGDLGVSAKVEWRLYDCPPLPIRRGMRVALFDPRGNYRGISRTVGQLVGFDRHWVTFILSPGRSAPTTVQTLSVPASNATIPLLARALRAVLAAYLPDEHPYEHLPLVQLDPLLL
ncbi:hypothetical protein EIP86_006823 [Pleurotus ostreatoroseus]|nr:hypothetical protein EIP86_006823 [Pleurotus ostreatoroseus]